MKAKKQNIDTLMTIWGNFANEYVETEDNIFEWQNSMDARRIIGEMIDSTSDAKKGKIKKDLKTYDMNVMDNTFEINESVWGEKIASEKGYDPHNDWYYFRMNQGVFDTEEGQFTKC